jgi:hypothetical protein
MAREDGNRASRVIGGLILLSLGVLFLLQNFGVVQAGRVWDYWPMFLVWAGLARLFAPRRAHHFAAGAVMLLLGVFLQLEELGFLWIRARDFWPALLVAAGLALVAESLVVKRRNGYDGGAGSYGGGAWPGDRS